MKHKSTALLSSLLIAALLCACSVTPPKSESTSASATTDTTFPSIATTTLASTSTAPSTEPVTTPTPELPPEPTVDVDRLIDDLSASLAEVDSPSPITRDFLRWLAVCYGDDILISLDTALKEDPYSQALWYDLTGNSIFVLSDLYSGDAELADNIHLISTGSPNVPNQVTTLTFGGDICFADNYVVMEYMKENGKQITDCIDRKLIDEMTAADIAFMNNEFTISDRGSPLENKYYTFRASPENTALYHTLGIDIVSLANNHAYDYGADAFADTLDSLKAHEIATIGGGKNLEEAMKPVYYLVNGRKIAFAAATRAEKYKLTPQATESSSGVLRCYDTALFLETIREAEANSDYVIACIHWGTEYSAELQDVQRETARDYIDAGVDLIIGAHAHQLQGIEYYNGVPIFYNLGNFWFNGYDIETGLVKVELFDDGSERCTFLPAMQSGHVTTSEIGTEKGAEILDHLEGYSIGVSIDENGVVTEK